MTFREIPALVEQTGGTGPQSAESREPRLVCPTSGSGGSAHLPSHPSCRESHVADRFRLECKSCAEAARFRRVNRSPPDRYGPSATAVTFTVPACSVPALALIAICPLPIALTMAKHLPANA